MTTTIAMDARYGLQSPRRGIGEYVFQTLQHLGDMPRRYDLHLFGDESADMQVVQALRSYYRVDILRAPNFFLWEQQAFPAAIRAYALAHGTANMAPLVSRVPVIMTVHDVIEFKRGQVFGGRIPLRHHISRLYRMNALQWLARRAPLIFTVSHHAASDIHQVLGVEADRIVVTPLAPKYPIHKPSWPKEPYVLALGAADPRKNTAAVVKAARYITAQGIAVKIVGVERQALAPLQDAASGNARLEVLGMVDDATLAHLYQQAGCFLYPSLYEGFGLPVLEAMALGCPVVTGKNSSLPEIAGPAALLVDTSDPQVLAEAALSIVQDPVKQWQLMEAGQAWVRAFSWKKTAELTHQGYERVLHEVANR
ncbi:MAG: glycosyltransferase family 1 protein [Sulfobacillus thermotolerans]|nr:glycosyltransferase family 1 protein [Sulfobacillus thermotolerans]